jgi:hypothetical protein
MKLDDLASKISLLKAANSPPLKGFSRPLKCYKAKGTLNLSNNKFSPNLYTLVISTQKVFVCYIQQMME